MITEALLRQLTSYRRTGETPRVFVARADQLNQVGEFVVWVVEVCEGLLNSLSVLVLGLRLPQDVQSLEVGSRIKLARLIGVTVLSQAHIDQHADAA